MNSAQISVRASTQEHLNIEDIQGDLVVLKDGSCCLVLQVTAINFGLLSESEQDAIIYAYAGLLNSLTFPVQIIIRSKKKDISSYLNLIGEQEKRLKKPALKDQLKKYRAFVEETVRKNEVLDKKFYISIPFSSLELGISNTLSQTFKPTKGLPYPKSYILEKAKTNLYPKRDHLIKQLSRLGLKSKELNTQGLLELFYNIYNPESVGQNFISTENYKVALVEAAIAGEKPEERKTSMDFSKKNLPDNTNQIPSSSKPAAADTSGSIPLIPGTPSPKPITGGGTIQSPTPNKTTPPTTTPSIVKSEDGNVPQTQNTNKASVSENMPGIQAEIDQAAQQVGENKVGEDNSPTASVPPAKTPAPFHEPQPPTPNK